MNPGGVRYTKPAALKRRSTQKLLHALVSYPLLIGLSVVFLVPFFWMVTTAFKDPSLIYRPEPTWIPPHITLENFRRALGIVYPSFQRLLLNSVAVTTLSVLGTVLSSSLVGFAFAFLPHRHKKPIFTLVLSTLMLPQTVFLIPQFILFTNIGWKDSWLPLIVPKFLASAFFIFMFRQFFATIPRELLDSAELDGCSPLGLYWRIALPLAKPAVATAAVFSFLGSWNDLMQPLIYLNDMSGFTLTLGLSMFQSGAMVPTPLQYLMPLALLALLPVLLVFIVGLDYFVQGIATTGMKG